MNDEQITVDANKYTDWLLDQAENYGQACVVVADCLKKAEKLEAAGCFELAMAACEDTIVAGGALLGHIRRISISTTLLCAMERGWDTWSWEDPQSKVFRQKEGHMDERLVHSVERHAKTKVRTRIHTVIRIRILRVRSHIQVITSASAAPLTRRSAGEAGAFCVRGRRVALACCSYLR